MPVSTPSSVAENALHTRVAQNAYPGRGLVLASRGAAGYRILYWIMGRSRGSQNRRFVAEGAVLRTEAVDESLVVDPSLIIYEAMLALPGVQLVTNGDQTRTVHAALLAGGDFDGALATREREPDAPHYTPRISGMIDLRQGSPRFALSVLKAGRFDPEQTDRCTFRPAAPAAGFGFALTTYRGDGDPLPSFDGEPFVVPTAGSQGEVLERYWSALDARNRVSLAVKDVSPSGETESIALRNRHDE